MKTHRFQNSTSDEDRIPSTASHVVCSIPCVPHPGDGLLEQLPPAEQEVMILSHFYGLAKDEIAAIIGASLSVVDMLLSSAVQHLRRQFPGPQAA